MTIRLGDHLVIKRGEKILGPEDESYHEFEVIKQPEWRPGPKNEPGYELHVTVVK